MCPCKREFVRMCQSFNAVWYNVKGLDDTSGCFMPLWQYPFFLKKHDYLAQNYRERMMQTLDVGLKWQAIAASILLGTSCYSPMSGDNISPRSLLEPFLEKCLLHPNIFVCCLSKFTVYQPVLWFFLLWPDSLPWLKVRQAVTVTALCTGGQGTTF